VNAGAHLNEAGGVRAGAGTSTAGAGASPPATGMTAARRRASAAEAVALGALPESLERFAEGLDLAALLTVATTRKVGKRGVRLDNRYYIHSALIALRGRRVAVRYRPDDRSSVDIYFEGQLRCTAPRIDLLTGEQVEDFYRERRRVRSQVRGHLRDYLRGLEPPEAHDLDLHRRRPSRAEREHMADHDGRPRRRRRSRSRRGEHAGADAKAGTQRPERTQRSAAERAELIARARRGEGADDPHHD